MIGIIIAISVYIGEVVNYHLRLHAEPVKVCKHMDAQTIEGMKSCAGINETPIYYQPH